MAFDRYRWTSNISSAECHYLRGILVSSERSVIAGDVIFGRLKHVDSSILGKPNEREDMVGSQVQVTDIEQVASSVLGKS